MTASSASGNRDAIDALEGNLWSLWSCFGRGPGCTLVETPELMRFETPVAQAPYNGVMRFQPDPATDVDARIEDVLAPYAARRVPLMWVVHPSARPDDLAARLEARGLLVDDGVMGMIAELGELPPEPPAPAGIEIVEVGMDDAEPVVELIAWRYQLAADAREMLRGAYRVLGIGTPGASTRIWVAMREGAPVSKVVMHVAAGAAGLHGVATRPEARGLGLARLLTLRALHAARERGETTAVLHATAMAESLYAAIGFKAVARFPLGMTPGALEL